MKIGLCDCAALKDGDLSRFFDALPTERRAYASRYKDPRDRATAAIGFLLVSRLIGERDPKFASADWAIGEHGKPYVPGAPFHFSLSHADGLCAAVLSRDPIGIDVELIRSLRRALLPRFCTPEEIERCENDPDLAVRLWTQREARAKENGRGIGQNLVALSSEGVTSFRYEAHGRAFWVSFTADEPAKILALEPRELI